MEIQIIQKKAGWYASYMDSEQGKALVECQAKKIEQLEKVIETIKGEIELTKEPKEYGVEIILDSIEALVNQIGEVEHTEGYFKWIG